MIEENEIKRKRSSLIADLRRTVDPEDEYGFKYIELIQNAINEGRITNSLRYSAFSAKRNKIKLFNSLNKDFEYSEVHHIIPKCCTGNNEPENLVLLYCTVKNPEHVLAHKYLWKSYSIFPNNKKDLTSAYKNMIDLRKCIEISDSEVAELRIISAQNQSSKLKGKRINNRSWLGRKHTDEEKAKMSSAWTEEMKNKVRKRNKEESADKKKNRIKNLKTFWKNNPEKRKQLSDSRKGENNNFFGKHHSDETKSKIRDAALNRGSKYLVSYLGNNYTLKEASKLIINGKTWSKETIRCWARDEKKWV